MVPTKTGIFLRGLNTMQSKQKENWGGGGGGVTIHFSEIIKLQFGKKKTACIVLYFTAF